MALPGGAVGGPMKGDAEGLMTTAAASFFGGVFDGALLVTVGEITSLVETTESSTNKNRVWPLQQGLSSRIFSSILGLPGG